MRELNINSIYQLAVQSPFDLSSRYEDTSLDFNSASAMIANARKILTEHEVLGKEFVTADQMLATQLVGEFGSGKSQICHTPCIAANKLMETSPHNDPEKSNKHSTSGNIIFTDTENTFRSERAYQIAEQNGLDPCEY